MTDPSTAPSPELFFQTATAYQRTEALKGALALDVFTAIAEGRVTAGALAERCRTSVRGMRILCDYLTILGFLMKGGDRYGLTADSATFLNRRSPAYLGGTLEFVHSRELTEGFSEVAAAVRRGGTVMAEDGTVAPEHPIWVAFARAMMPMMLTPAQAMASLVEVDAPRTVRVLDVAAGHGLFGIALAERHANVEVVALDWRNVLKVAQENAQAAGLSGRYGTIEGDAFEVDWGHGYDLVLLTNFLHHFDQAGCERLLRKARAALADGGRAVTLEFVPNEDRVSPPETAGFALVMLCTTPSGDAYTFAEYDRMFHNAGFARNEVYPLPPTRQQVIISFT